MEDTKAFYCSPCVLTVTVFHWTVLFRSVFSCLPKLCVLDGIPKLPEDSVPSPMSAASRLCTILWRTLHSGMWIFYCEEKTKITRKCSKTLQAKNLKSHQVYKVLYTVLYSWHSIHYFFLMKICLGCHYSQKYLYTVYFVANSLLMVGYRFQSGILTEISWVHGALHQGGLSAHLSEVGTAQYVPAVYRRYGFSLIRCHRYNWSCLHYTIQYVLVTRDWPCAVVLYCLHCNSRNNRNMGIVRETIG